MGANWAELGDLAEATKTRIGSLEVAMAEELRGTCSELEARVRDERSAFRETAPYSYSVGFVKALEYVQTMEDKLSEMEGHARTTIKTATLFGVQCTVLKQIDELLRECRLLKGIWSFDSMVRSKLEEWLECKWSEVQTDVLESTCQDFIKEMRKMDREVKGWNVFTGLDKEVKQMVTQLQVAVELRSPTVRERHWIQLLENVGSKFDRSNSTLKDIVSLNLDLETVRAMADRAAKELQMEKHLDSIKNTWEDAKFVVKPSPHGHDTLMLVGSEALLETLEDNQVLLQNMMANRNVQFFQPQILRWQEILGNLDLMLHLLLDVQQSWSHLVSIFVGSEDIKAQLPDDAAKFAAVDAMFLDIMKEIQVTPGCLNFCSTLANNKRLEDALMVLSLCERSLSQYLDKKRQVFPRFYFVSRMDLLDILSKGAIPSAVCAHLPKLFDSIARLKFAADEAGNETKTAIGMISKEGEYVPFSEPLECIGQVETWLNKLVECMRTTLRHMLSDAVTTYQEKPREQWLFDYPAQIVLAATQIWWNTEVNVSFSRLEEGYENAMKEYHRKQCNQITGLIQLIQGDLSPLDRTKIMTVCTLDVHARDVVTKLLAEKADSSQCFSWLSQLRLMWDDEKSDCFANIADAAFKYSYEYLGCTPRLVVTPLTDRCYITLTQALHLNMGGAPAGPAGTGKTETTKDLGRALGCMVYVFNCSEQMDYKSIGNIYRGLAQEGAWGCFDEFNRIPVDVLSVIGTQVKSIQDALRAKKTTFVLEGEMTRLHPNVGIFITMNPGYAGRTELPENIKALFRPCSMVIPDLQLICEIMLMAEGFVEASVLAQKFTTLYKLCKELLSQQDHYDWGLRAIKSVLVVAGSLKRADPEMPESHILMRSLRDFNVPKIVTGDLPIFLGLVHDLFPGVEVARKKTAVLEDAIRKAAIESGLQADDNFVLKVVQLEELLAVRHSVFIIGPPGSGKSQVWKTLSKAKSIMGKRCLTTDLDPKAVTTDELYGCVHPTTREWKDGLFSSLLRDMASANADVKWIVLDGDIDPNWIESLNTVMDDNKVLTLASNERIPLQPNMRLLFEISDLRNATPATVSRAGILYLNASDIGYGPLLQTWLDKCEDVHVRTILSNCFDKYLAPCIDYVQGSKARIVAVETINLVGTMCDLLGSLLKSAKIPKGSDKEVYEMYFCFSAIWAFGGVMASNGDLDGRADFNGWWHNSELKQISTVPSSTGTVFDFCVDNSSRSWKTWSEVIAKNGDQTGVDEPEVPFSALFVPTPETAALSYIMDALIDAGRHILLVGNAGCGKTLMAKAKMQDCIDSAKYEGLKINLTYYTNGVGLQHLLEKPLEKKAGRSFAPKGNGKLVYLLDDLNMPEVDKYGTVECHALLRQHVDHSHWYDRNKLTLKEISNCQYLACMNPKVGSFTISQRLQRHFATLAVPKPSSDRLLGIYSSSLQARLPGLGPSIRSSLPHFICATMLIHAKAQKVFQATANKPHYHFSLHDLALVFEGMCMVGSKDLSLEGLAKLWVHELRRAYSDKLTSREDMEVLGKIIEDSAKSILPEIDIPAVASSLLLFGSGLKGVDATYQNATSWEQLNGTLSENQEQYNETHAALNLILFDDAVSHAFRIARLLKMPGKHGLLVGVGGSGKQSLAKLGAYIAGMETFQITPSPTYNVTEMRNDLANLFIKTGQKKQPVVLLLPDGHISDERLLIPINEYLCTGDISGLFAEDALDTIMSAMRTEAKALGLGDSRKVCWELFLRNVAANFKIIMCCSPIGASLKLKLQRFPGLLSQMQIDWFHEWPQEALGAVATGLLESCNNVPAKLVAKVATFMGSVHLGISSNSKELYAQEKRRVYTTPKSFLSYVELYKKMLDSRRTMVVNNMDRLAKGLQKLQTTAEQVDELKIKLAAQDIELAAKNDVAEKLIQKVAQDTEKVNSQKSIADEEEKRVNQITQEVSERQAQCENDLQAAEPALAAAAKALNTLNKANLTELKSFGSPTADIVNVVAAVMVLLSPPGKIAKNRTWKAGKNMMAKVDQFLDSLIHFKKEAIDQSNLDAVQAYLSDPNFNEEYIGTKSVAAAGLCSWVVNIVKYYKVFKEVEPKRLALEAANEELKESQAKLAAVQAHVAELDANLMLLKEQFEKATQEKLECTRAAKETSDTIALANRLVLGLSSEKTRWGTEYARNEEELKTLPADSLVAASFMAYAGPFPKRHREHLVTEWVKALRGTVASGESEEAELRISSTFTLGSSLMTSMEQAKWVNEGLPTDQTSLENAAIITKASRWPLVVDPQLQAISWLCQRDSKLQVTQLSSPSFFNILSTAMASGTTLLIEDVGESIDPSLEPLLSQSTIRGGRFIKLGDKEIEYHQDFRLILQTRLSNPNYPPEIQAQTAIVNFSVTIDGLEDQLLADVVKNERPDLEEGKRQLTKNQNEFKVRLLELENSLLEKLSAAQGDFLKDTSLVESLENTKFTASAIEAQVKEALVTEKTINVARECYRPVAKRAAQIYFLLNDLWKINPVYQYSLFSVKAVFLRALAMAAPAAEAEERIARLKDTITEMVFLFTNRGLFEKDKLTFITQLTFLVSASSGEGSAPESESKSLPEDEVDFVLRGPAFDTQQTSKSPPGLEWLPETGYSAIKQLSTKEGFKTLSVDIENSAKQWKKYCELEAPELEKMPQDWKNKTPLQKLCVLRCLRPDRMINTIRQFVRQQMGAGFLDVPNQPLLSLLQTEIDQKTPVFFILSPGVDPLKDVEAAGRQLGFSQEAGTLSVVSLGQGQEARAEQCLLEGSRNGTWVMLQNIHLVSKWLPKLASSLEKLSSEAHSSFRLFVSAEPAADPEFHIIPSSILQRSIKITNEPPTGMKANLHRAIDSFEPGTMEKSSKDTEYRALMFALFFFHSVVLERRKFGVQGWNKPYPFTTGDLLISGEVLYNYLENYSRIPWVDLRYIIGEIMYGGHISDYWDRRLCTTYLEAYMPDEQMFERSFELTNGFVLPAGQLDLKDYHAYVDANLPAEAPGLYRMHANAEIEVLSKMSDYLFKCLLAGQQGPQRSSLMSGQTEEDKLLGLVEDMMERLPEAFNLADLYQRAEDRTPYTNVVLQECELMNRLVLEIAKLLRELSQALKGTLTFTPAMETNLKAIASNEVPKVWMKFSYPSQHSLQVWYADLLQRVKQLESWVADFQVPHSVWLGGLFSPQSFLTAIMQTTARRMDMPIDKLALAVEVTKKSREEISSGPRDGAYIHGLRIEGARWDTASGSLQDAALKDLRPAMPVMHIKAVSVERKDVRGTYECPLYRTKIRGPTFVCPILLKTKEKASKWTLTGAALFLE
ncbi:dynein heavy chain [Hyaloraphidium curvatum]|nr:dynein heavy chain [Hyaloraphidium curvatum]